MGTALVLLNPVTLVASMTYVAVARLGGARVAWSRDVRMVVCTDAPRWWHGRGGTTIGCVYVTSHGLVRDAMLRHEARHRDQWAIGGPVFALCYGVEAWRTRRDVTRNVFERAAGLADGGYER